MPELATIYDYMRAHATMLGERILQEYPALHPFDAAIPPRIDRLLRRPFPAQTIAGAERLFADKVDTRNELYAKVGRLRSEAETMSFVGL